MSTPTLQDYRWLTSEGASYLAAPADDLLALATRWRKNLSRERVHLLLEQMELRRRGRKKFAAADRMFFTRVGLEQATDEVVAEYKAGRFLKGTRLADLCCGIGGDLLGLATRGPVVAIDRDPIAIHLAEANCRVCGLAADAVKFSVADVLNASFDDCIAAHLDPDRRPQGRRTTHVEAHEPSLEQINSLRQRVPNLAIKLAPGAQPPDEWRDLAEWEWIGRDGECRQLVAWFGSLTGLHGQRRATVLGTLVRTLTGNVLELPIATSIGNFVFEPDASVLAAHLQGVLAAEHDLAAISAGSGYLTGDRVICDAALAAFEVDTILPLDVKKLRSLLRQRDIGRLEIKKRNVPLEPEQLRQQLSLQGSKDSTLILTPHRSQTVAILCRRLSFADTPSESP